MDKTKIQTLKGFRDFLPKEAEKRLYTQNLIRKTFEVYGFEPLETPALEYQELLLGKYGGEADKLIYTFKDRGGRDVALRYDQTVPTARVLALNQANIPLPWRRYQIQPVWRAENPQRGRFREFLQCDADIYGPNSYLADAEVISLSNAVYKNLGFKKFKIFINDRKILFELVSFASIPPELQLSVISAIDKLDRLSKEEVSEELKNLGLNETIIKHLFSHIDFSKPTENLRKIIKYAISLGVEKEKLLFQARLARGLDYYTSTIFEIKIDDYKVGSVLGGGRYDKLIGALSGIDIPACGFAIGFDRTVEAMEQFNLFPALNKQSVLVAIFNSELTEMAALVAQNLRANGMTAELFPSDEARLEKQIKYADKKGITWFVVIGPDEIKKNAVILKNLKTGLQEDVPLKTLVKKIKTA